MMRPAEIVNNDLPQIMLMRNLIVEVERRIVVGAEGLAVEAARKSTRRKIHPLTADEKAEKARLDAAERRSASGAKLLVLMVYYVRLKTKNDLTGRSSMLFAVCVT